MSQTEAIFQRQFFRSKLLQIFRIPVLGVPGSSFRTVEPIICRTQEKSPSFSCLL